MPIIHQIIISRPATDPYKKRSGIFIYVSFFSTNYFPPKNSTPHSPKTGRWLLDPPHCAPGPPPFAPMDDSNYTASAFSWSFHPWTRIPLPSGGMCGVRLDWILCYLAEMCRMNFGCSGFLYEIGAVGEAAELFLHFLGKDWGKTVSLSFQACGKDDKTYQTGPGSTRV